MYYSEYIQGVYVYYVVASEQYVYNIYTPNHIYIYVYLHAIHKHYIHR